MNLDGVQFTVDSMNQIHCIDDFHRCAAFHSLLVLFYYLPKLIRLVNCYSKFAPKCCVCLQSILPAEGSDEVLRVVSMDRNFHPHCYKCEVRRLIIFRIEQISFFI